MNPWLALLIGIVIGDVLRGVLQYVQPRRGVPSPVQRTRNLATSHQALAVREQEWTQWAMYVAGVAAVKGIDLPAMPGTAEWRAPWKRSPRADDPAAGPK
jgi:hypothetical protein